MCLILSLPAFYVFAFCETCQSVITPPELTIYLLKSCLYCYSLLHFLRYFFSFAFQVFFRQIFQPVFLVVGKGSLPSSLLQQQVPRSEAFLTCPGQMVLLLTIVTLCRHSSVSQLHVLHQFSIFKKFAGIFSLPLSPFQFSCHLYLLTVILTDIWGVQSATFNWKLALFIL